jgi:hypothetical protein
MTGAGAGLSAIRPGIMLTYPVARGRAQTPPPNPLPQGEGECGRLGMLMLMLIGRGGGRSALSRCPVPAAWAEAGWRRMHPVGDTSLPRAHG